MRTHLNHALEDAVQQAYDVKLLIGAFSLTPAYPEVNGRHCEFFLKGLRNIERRMRE